MSALRPPVFAPTVRLRVVQDTLFDPPDPSTLPPVGVPTLPALPPPAPNGGPVFLDLETTALEPWKGHVRLCTVRTGLPEGSAAVTADFGWPGENGSYRVPDDKAGQWILDALTRGSYVVAHNAAFELNWLLWHFPDIRERLFALRWEDTMIAALTLTRGRLDRHASLKAAAKFYLGLDLEKDEQKSDWGATNLSPAQLDYARADVDVLPALHATLVSVLRQHKLSLPYDADCRTMVAAARMTFNGIHVDRHALSRLRATSLLDAQDRQEELRKLWNHPNLNLGSPVQLAAAFERVGIRADSTGANALLPHQTREDVKILLSYREAHKQAEQAGSYLDAAGPGRRIRANYGVARTDTGRMSCREPNVQNIPRASAMRACFTAPPGRLLVQADYAQIELRAAAALGNDGRMLSAFRTGKDLHRVTAAGVFQVDEADVTKDQRQLAKVLNFLCLYGGSPTRFRDTVKETSGQDIPLDRCAELVAGFFRTYPGLAAWHERALANASDWSKGPVYAYTLGGVRRELRREDGPRANQRKILSVEASGSCADGMKKAFRALTHWLSAYEDEPSFIVACVHDEILVECPNDETRAKGIANHVARIMVEGMKSVLGRTGIDVPVSVEANIISNWSEK